ncbi:MAG: ABC transporter ATP-binding protein [Dehalococcoidales bacterium]|nr:ABC transporter ATP-binding protein [Dehalococcoidales bacterium]
MSAQGHSFQSKQTYQQPPAGGFMGRGRGPMGGGPMHMAGMGGEKPKNFKRTMITLAQYLKPYRISLAIAMILAVASTVFTIIGPKLMGKATTKLFEGLVSKVTSAQGGGIDFAYIGHIILVLLVLYLVATVCSYIMGYLMTTVSIKVTYDLRKKISEKINRLPMKYFDTKTYGEVLSYVTNDVDTISTTLNQSMFQIVMSIATVIGVLVMMLTISWLMTLVAILIIPLSTIFVAAVIKKSQVYFRQQQDYLGHVNGHVEEMYAGHNVMKAFNGEEKSIRKFNGLNEELYKSGWKSQFLSGIMIPTMMFIGNLGYVAVCILGGYLTIKKTIEVGDILAFIQYVRSFTQPLAQIAAMVNILQSTAAAAERVFEFLSEEEEIPEEAHPATLEKVVGSISFKDVSFGYLDGKTVINNFSADIKPGQKVAIVGPTGAGKTTVVKLLMRFYDVNEGSILLDGVDIRQFRRNDYRSVFGMVLQDTWLFNSSIKENIRYGKIGASDEEIFAAAKLANIDHFVHTLPGGYDMVINEEANNISQGEKQLLTIARAVLADPKILILDEATSSVDTRTEVLIQEAMIDLMKGRTSFIIAHRLSTIRNADIILVMRDGEIVEQGSHEKLLQANGFYASLYNSQFETTLPENGKQEFQSG